MFRFSSFFVFLSKNRLQKLKVPFGAPVGWVVIGCFIGGILRMFWWVLEYLQPRERDAIAALRMAEANYVISRLAWLFLTWAFLALVWGWIDAIYVKYPVPSKGFLQAIKYFMVVMGVADALWTITVIVLAWTLCTDRARFGSFCVTFADSHVVYFCLLTASISMGLFLYSGIILYMLRHNDKDREEEGKQWTGVFTKAVIVSLICVICFSARCLIFMYNPITQRSFPEWAFYIFGYVVPETIPSLVMMLMAVTTSRSNRKFIAAQVGQAGSNYIQLEEMPDDMVDEE